MKKLGGLYRTTGTNAQFRRKVVLITASHVVAGWKADSLGKERILLKLIKQENHRITILGDVIVSKYAREVAEAIHLGKQLWVFLSMIKSRQFYGMSWSWSMLLIGAVVRVLREHQGVRSNA